MGQQTKHLMDEADIGSGEKSPGQLDVERDERAVPPLHGNDGSDDAATGNGASGRVMQSGTHLARIVAAPQEDGTFEAQVYVRLTREPELAETYIPVGIYPTADDAWRAAEERAQRAFREQEF